jgi:CXXX repeat modification system protein
MTQLTTEESIEFLALHERKIGLFELIRYIDILQNEQLYNRIISDLGETKRKYDTLWLNIKKKYNYLYYPDKDLIIDFEKGTVSSITDLYDPELKTY